MPQQVVIGDVLVTIIDVDFKCPKCECPHQEDDWYPRYKKSKNGLIYRNCKGCKTKLGITTDIKGDVRVWLKEDESNSSL